MVKKYSESDDIIKVPRFNESSGFYTTSEKSKLMSKIRSKNTQIEVIFRKKLWEYGLRYRLHMKGLPGKPDIVMKKHKLVIFIDGEFWHGYNWEDRKTKIKTNRDYWIPKIERNMQRDVENNIKLKKLGFLVIRFWEHEVRKDLIGCVQIIIKHLSK